jgi:serine/threonine protein kinase
MHEITRPGRAIPRVTITVLLRVVRTLLCQLFSQCLSSLSTACSRPNNIATRLPAAFFRVVAAGIRLKRLGGADLALRGAVADPAITLPPSSPTSPHVESKDHRVSAAASVLDATITAALTTALAAIFDAETAAQLARFTPPAVAVADIQQVALRAEHDGALGLRVAFRDLLRTFDINTLLPPAVCAWLNDGGKNALRRLPLANSQTGGSGRSGGTIITASASDALHAAGRPDFFFAPSTSTLFTFALWVGDEVCIDLALALGAAATDVRDSENVTRAPVALACLRRGDWQARVARGRDVQRCRLEQPLGQGSFATVFPVMYANRRCALKRFNVFFGTLDVGMLQQVLVEVRTLLQVQHSSVVKCHGFFLWDPQYPQVQPCLLLEQMDLGFDKVLLPLEKAVAAGGAAGVAEAEVLAAASLQGRLESLIQVALGVEYLHGLSPPVIHRDIKPANILLSFSAGVCSAKLADFGISQSNSLGTALGAGGSKVHLSTGAAGQGTAEFASPEQWDRRRTQSTKADVFSFGLTVFAAVCKVASPWMSKLSYESALQRDEAAYQDLRDIVARVAQQDWPEWPPAVPDTCDQPTASVPLWLRELVRVMVTAEPVDRLAMFTVRQCLRNEQPPAAMLGNDMPLQGAWKTVADEALGREAVPLYFDPSYAFPPFLDGLAEVPVPTTMENAVLTLAAASEIDLSTALRELQKSRRHVQQALAKWKADGDGGAHAASLALDHESLVAIAFYTSDGVYAAMNAALRSGQRRRVLPFLPYLKLLLQVRRQFL